MDLNLAWRTHFHALLIFWGDGQDLAYFVNDQSKSKLLGHLTAQHIILISTSGVGTHLRMAGTHLKMRVGFHLRMRVGQDEGWVPPQDNFIRSEVDPNLGSRGLESRELQH